MFPTTQWTAIAKATLHGDQNAAMALETFCQRYRKPIMAFLQLRGVVSDQVEDLAHDFLFKVMTHSSLRRADRTKGKFRSYLSSSLANFIVEVQTRRNADKRGGGVPDLSFDVLQDFNVEPTDERFDREMAASFDRVWAVSIMEAAFAALETHMGTSRQRRDHWPVLKRFLLPGLRPVSYEHAAEQVGISQAALRVDVSRQRARFRELLRHQVAQTVGSPSEVDEEMRHLFEVLNTVDDHPTTAQSNP